MLQEVADMEMRNLDERVREVLKEALEKMEKGGEYGPHYSRMIPLSISEVKYLLELSDEQASYEQAYNAGFEYGYQRAVKDVIKRLREMKTYGGGYKKVRAGEMPEGTGRAAESVQREL